MRDHLQIAPPPSLINLNPLSWSRGSAFEQKSVDISGFTGKPVTGEGFNDPRGV